MRWNLFYIGMIVSLFIYAGSVSAICITGTPYYRVSELQPANNRDAVIVDVFESPYHLITDTVTFTDTVYLTDLRSELVRKYIESDVVVVAEVTNVTRFIPPFTEDERTVCASDSVTVSIEMTLKGDIESEWNFIALHNDQLYTLTVDPETGDSSVTELWRSHSAPGYGSVVNQRFLLFLDDDDVPNSSNMLFPIPLPQSPCEKVTNAYALNDHDEVYFDGFVFDSAARTVSSVPELTVSFEEFFDAIITGTRAEYGRLHTAGAAGNAQTQLLKNDAYNLLGRKLPSGRGQKRIPKPAGVYLYRSNGFLKGHAAVYR